MIYLVLAASIAAAVLKNPKTWLLWLMAITILLAAPNEVRWWNNFHYWLGSKYHAELGLFELYECTQAARMSDGLRRNLDDYTWTTGPADCQAEFTPDRWYEFRIDVSWISLTYPKFDRALTDKGLNATPTWLAFGVPLANMARPDVLRWIDPAFLLLALVVAVRSIGWHRAGYVFLFTVCFWGTFDRLQGNYMQYIWLALSIAAASLLQRNKEDRLAGWLLGIAAALRVFPIFLLIGRSRTVLTSAIMAGTVAGLVGFSAGGLDAYWQMLENMRLHGSYIATEPYNVSLVNTASLTGRLDTVQAIDEAMRAGQSYDVPETVAWWPALLPVVAGAGWIGILFGLVTLSRYYYTILAVWIIERPEHTRIIFGINALTVGLLIFDTDMAISTFNVSLLILFATITWRRFNAGSHTYSIWRWIGAARVSRPAA